MELWLMDILQFFISDLNSSGDFWYTVNSGNTGDFGTSGGENPTGGSPGGGPGGGPSNNNDVAAVTSGNEESRGERRVNAMSLTQMCTHSIEDRPIVNIPDPLSKESLRTVHDVLQAEQKEYWENNPSRKYKVVTLNMLGYNLNTKEGTVVSDLLTLKRTVAEFEGKGLFGRTNVDKVIFYCKKNM